MRDALARVWPTVLAALTGVSVWISLGGMAVTEATAPSTSSDLGGAGTCNNSSEVITCLPSMGRNGKLLGTEPVAMQRGNLDMANLAAFDVQKQIPAWSITTTPYLFRDAAHLKKVFDSDVGKQLNKMVEDQLGIKVLAWPYIGTRHLNLKPKKKITKASSGAMK